MAVKKLIKFSTFFTCSLDLASCHLLVSWGIVILLSVLSKYEYNCISSMCHGNYENQYECLCLMWIHNGDH